MPASWRLLARVKSTIRHAVGLSMGIKWLVSHAWRCWWRIQLHEFLNGEITTTNSDHYWVIMHFHVYALLAKVIGSLRLSDKQMLHMLIFWEVIDVFSQFLINWIIPIWNIDPSGVLKLLVEVWNQLLLPDDFSFRFSELLHHLDCRFICSE